MTVSSPVGEVVRDATGVLLRYRRSLPATPEQVWHALTDQDALAVWFGRWTGDPASGRVELVMTGEDAGSPEPVLLRACDVPTRLAVDLESPDGTWPLEVSLEPAPGGTALTLVHVLSEPYDAAGIGPGWQYYLDRLEAAVAGTPLPDEWEPYAALAPGYALPEHEPRTGDPVRGGAPAAPGSRGAAD